MIELLSRNVCVVALDDDAGEARPLLEAHGIACEATPDPDRTNVFLHPHGKTLAVCSADGGVVALVRRPLQHDELLAAIDSAARFASLQRDAQAAEELLHVGRALGAERDVLALQRLILRKARELTNADAGSLLLIEEQNGERILRFAVAQTGPDDDGTHAGAAIPLSETSIVGSVALSGETLRIADAYRMDASLQRFDDSFDKRTGYRTKSVLCVPMRNYRDDVVGVIQLINRKPGFGTVLASAQQTLDIVEPFDERDEHVALALAAQAGVALENSRLVESIQGLFEHFVRAAVTAIEVRDVSTQGHSERVAALTIAQAKAINEIESGPLRSVAFDADRLRELRYAALLHDFGKVSVAEYIFSKSKKLPDGKLEAIQTRFLLAMEQIEAATAREKFAILRDGNPDAETLLEAADERCRKAIDELGRLCADIERANEPAIVDKAIDDALAGVTRYTYRAGSGVRPLIESSEYEYLQIPRGSLSHEERALMQQHVNSSYRFLSAIPWNTTPWPGVAEIAYSHHEHLDGTGYPRRLTADRIPPQVRMLTISDIYDALTANDRPYKKAVPVEKALDILQREFADRGKIDPLYLDVFISKRLYAT
jgi:HD-GYP domain-containing protein (c-di-GMP phosphodiesterase class II)